MEQFSRTYVEEAAAFAEAAGWVAEDDESEAPEPDGDWEASHPDQCSTVQWAAYRRHSAR
jgi:hypothetical protein